MNRALSVENVLNARFSGLEFEGKWKDVFGQPELAHSWIIWGQSGSGKTTFNMQLAKYISQFERVLYNSMEEGLSASIQGAYNRAGLRKGDKLTLVSEGMQELEKRLSRKKSPRVVIIDSIKYTRFRWSQYERFCQRFPNKVLIWVGHAKGKDPKGSLAQDIRYDAFVKIYVEGYRAFVTSRYSSNSNGYIDVWEEAAEAYHNDV